MSCTLYKSQFDMSSYTRASRWYLSSLHKYTWQVVFRTIWSRDRDVVLVGRTIDLGWWEFGMGWDGEGEVSSRVTWDQGWQDSTTQKEGFQVSKREGWQKGISKGSKRGGGMLHTSTASLPMRYFTTGYTSMRYTSTALYFYKQFTQAPNKLF